jgi:hypothetical protein
LEVLAGCMEDGLSVNIFLRSLHEVPDEVGAGEVGVAPVGGDVEDGTDPDDPLGGGFAGGDEPPPDAKAAIGGPGKV